ncbi:MAG TPA: metallophosphoesterase [Saprospiraceae bacterium]|nr:metallophosphoesterase [Saprospiraceae bacterium]
MTAFFVSIIVYLIIDIYGFYGVLHLFEKRRPRIIASIINIVMSLLVFYSFAMVKEGIDSVTLLRYSKFNWAIGWIITAFVSQTVFAAGLLFQDVFRWILGGFRWLKSKKQEIVEFEEEMVFVPSRRKFVTSMAMMAAAIPFTSLLYGISKGKYKFQLKRVPLAFENLPKSFDGLKIIQISDIHAGSLDSPEDVMQAVNMINEQNPDIILFTGDLVNSNKDEVDPYIDIFAQLKAKHGVYATLGNHDYYGLHYIDESEHEAYWKDFYNKYERLNFKLLNNTCEKIYAGDESFNLIGVENWGASKWFPKMGDLDMAMKTCDDSDFNLLMSHDPTHWEQKVKDYHKNVDLTLSGHTHGMQMGINIPGIKWSPAKFRYKHWMGLYEENGKYLYVNPGFGFLGFPGRVGIWPEITMFELSSLA